MQIMGSNSVIGPQSRIFPPTLRWLRVVRRAAAFLGSVTVLAFLTGCNGGPPSAAAISRGSPVVQLMDFSAPLQLDPVPAGWHHKKFLLTPPMDISFQRKDGHPAIRLATRASASMLVRYADVEIAAYPRLKWEWMVERPIESAYDERIGRDGDDHPARIYLKFRGSDGAEHAMELIWGNVHLHAGDWKHLKSMFGLRSFPHYVVNGGNGNVGRWFREFVQLTDLYRALWGDPAGARLVEVALFCDSDNTGSSSIAYFSDVRLEAK